MLNVNCLLLITSLSLFSFEVVRAQNPVVPKVAQLTFKYEDTELNFASEFPLPKENITNKSLEALTKEVDYLLFTQNLSSMDQVLILPYLANAQKDFAWLSYLTTGKWTGNLGPVTLWTLRLFLPDATLPSVTEESFDLYSSALAALVVEKLVKRLNVEKAQIADYPIKRGKELWEAPASGYRGLNFGSMKTWYIDSSKQFLAQGLNADSTFWKEQCAQVKKIEESANGAEKEAVFEWAGLTSIGSGDWNKIVTDYLQRKNIPIEQQLYVRAVVFSALADSNAVAFNSKYTYWVKRPSQRDSTIHPLIKVPNHPSYPSAHSTLSGTVAEVLSYFFPEDKSYWNKTAETAGMSRIWGGVHYPIDHLNGLTLGQQVAEVVLKKEGIHSNQTP
jgi:PAP2 superfamily